MGRRTVGQIVGLNRDDGPSSLLMGKRKMVMQKRQVGFSSHIIRLYRKSNKRICGMVRYVVYTMYIIHICMYEYTMHICGLLSNFLLHNFYFISFFFCGKQNFVLNWLDEQTRSNFLFVAWNKSNCVLFWGGGELNGLRMAKKYLHFEV